MFLIGWLVGLLLSLAFFVLGLTVLFGSLAVYYRGIVYPLFHTGWSWIFLVYWAEWFVVRMYVRGDAILGSARAEKHSYRRLMLTALASGVPALALYYWQYHNPSYLLWTLWLIPLLNAWHVMPISTLSMVLLARYEQGEPPPQFRPPPQFPGAYEDWPSYRFWRGFMKPVLGFATLYDNRFKKKQQPDTSLGAGREGTLTDAEKAGLL